MAAPTDVLSRIDEIESELRGLSAELHELRALVTQAAVAPAAEPAPSAAGCRSRAPAGRSSARRPGSAPRGRNRRRAHPPLRGRAERGARRARACDRVLPYQPAGSAAGSNRSSRTSRAISRPCGRGPRSLPGRRVSRRLEAGRPRGPERSACDAAGSPRGSPRARRAAGARGPGHAGDPGRAGQDPPHGCAARRRLGSARPARLRDHRWRRHGVRHHPALRARREPRLDHAGDARRLRRLRLGGSRRRRVLGAVALRPAADVARRRRRGHRGRLRHAGRSRGPLRPRARLARAPARGRPRGASPS